MADSSALILDTHPKPEVFICMLHGLGASGYDFETLPEEFNFPPALKIRFFFPHAPSLKVEINGNFLMPAWYNMQAKDPWNNPDQKGIENSKQYITHLLKKQYAEGFTPQKTILAGFSQGGAMALSLFLDSPKEYLGIVALSTYLPQFAFLTNQPFPKDSSPIFMAHGQFDPVIPFEIGYNHAQFLLKKGAKLQFENYPMGHSLCTEEIQALRKFCLQLWQV